jgi:hypothetical protein
MACLGVPVFALLLASAVASASWTVTDQEHDCTFYRGEVEASGATAVRVVCDWDVPPADLSAVLSQPGTHAGIFSSLGEAETISRAGPLERVRQVHVARGATDREVVVDIRTTDVPEGKRFAWTKARDQSARRTDGVEPDLTDGFWEVTDRGGRSHLVYEIRYLAGGRVPALLVRWFQVSGIKGVIGDLRGFMDRR